MRVAGLSRSETEVEARLEALRAELGPLTLDVASGSAPGQRARKLEEELGEVDAGLQSALDGLATARSDDSSETAREQALGDVRGGSERAIRHARRAEGLLGERHREKMRARMAGAEELLDDVRAALAAVEAAATAIRARVERTESTVVGNEGDGDEIADELRACSKIEFELQGQMRSVSEELTQAEVEAAHLGDRRAEAEREMALIVEKLGEEVPPAEAAMTAEERAEIDRRLERLDRRRAQIGPVNPLAEREYEEASDHVEQLQAQREDTERAMRELESLIREIDDEIERAFEETFEATATNFEEMVEHLFPGGRGRLRRVNLRAVRDDEQAAPPSARTARRRSPIPTRRSAKNATSSGSRSRSTRRASRPANCR